MSDAEIELTPQETARRLAAGDVQVIDVREQYEWDTGHIAGVRHIELQHLSSQAATIDPDMPVVFHCRTGARSLMAAQAFRRGGFEAYSMSGGIEQWHQEGRGLEPADGSVAAH